MLENEIALVTGASRGIGQAVALELGRNGATVIGTATSSSGAEKISNYLKENNINGFGLELNVTDSESIDAAIKQLRSNSALLRSWSIMPALRGITS